MDVDVGVVATRLLRVQQFIICVARPCYEEYSVAYLPPCMGGGQGGAKLVISLPCYHVVAQHITLNNRKISQMMAMVQCPTE